MHREAVGAVQMGQLASCSPGGSSVGQADFEPRLDRNRTVSRVGVEEAYRLEREGGMRSGRGSGSQAGLREGSTAGLPVKATLSRGLEAASAAGQERGPTATLRTMTVPGGSPTLVSSLVRWLLLYCLSCTCLPFLVNCGCHFKIKIVVLRQRFSLSLWLVF